MTVSAAWNGLFCSGYSGDTTEYVDNETDQSKQGRALKKLEKFEKLTITSMADYYTFTETYNSLKI